MTITSKITRKDHPELWEARLRRILLRVEELSWIRREERFLKQQQEELLEQPAHEPERNHLRLVPDE